MFVDNDIQGMKIKKTCKPTTSQKDDNAAILEWS